MSNGKSKDKTEERRKLHALRVKQWQAGWDEIDFDPKERRSKPMPYFYQFSIPAVELRSLCGIYRRTAKGLGSRSEDTGIQRQHDIDRSEEINRFVEYGYPWSTISKAKRQSDEYNDLRKPGWLPTAIVINILTAADVRRGRKVAESDLVTVDDTLEVSSLSLPYASWGPEWEAGALPPFEVIDGQHRLFAFGDDISDDFELPVVAFRGLDISWQAYLFYTINIKPKRINASLAFDLYPLLRSEDWLERAEGHSVYRETRAQEITEVLWSHKLSPWFDRINMLGERGADGVSQSAWIRSIMATMIKPWSQRGSNTGGLFGSRLTDGEEVLGWNRAQQAAFLIFCWKEFAASVDKDAGDWARSLRTIDKARSNPTDGDAAFIGPYSLIATDQGVRGFLQIINDVTYFSAAKWKLNEWYSENSSTAADVEAVTQAVKSFEKTAAASPLKALIKSLSLFDWRTSGTPDLEEKIRRGKLVFRGSGGYKELRLQLLEHIERSGGDFVDLAVKIRTQVFGE